MKPATKTMLIWDWPIRVFHWLFAASISLSLGIALIGEEHSRLFEWHMLFGTYAAFLLTVRVLLGFAGSKHALWLSMIRELRNIPASLRPNSGNAAQKTGGHNPVAWAVYLLMFGLLAGTVWTGANLQDNWTEELHPVLAWLLLGCIVTHLLGLALHSFKFRENISASMLTGRKQAPVEDGIASPKALPGMLVLGLCLTFAWQLFAGHQSASGKVQIPWIRTTVALGEAAEGGKGHHEGKKKRDSGHPHEREEHDEHHH
jgi:cytochrome b